MSVDLHSHSTASDGSYSPSELARAFAANGIRIAALTDHDTVGGTSEFIRTCEEIGIVGITGIEFSTIYQGREIHLLGYGLPLDDPRCSGFLNGHYAYMKERCIETLRKLEQFGYEISIDEVYEISDGNPPMPPHVIRAIANHGHISDIQEAVIFFNEYLAFGTKAWVDHETSIEEPLRMLIEVGAIAIAAHPFRFPDLKLLEDILDMGAHGFELYYPGQTGVIFQELESIAKKRDCIVTGGCDFHGAFAQREIREVEIPLKVGIELLKAIGRKIPAELVERGGVSG